MQKIDLNDNDEIATNSSKKNVKIGKKYKATIQVKGLQGEIFSAYFGVVFLDHNGKEISRKIQWLNDFNNIEKTIEIIFKALSENTLLIYRINNETPRKSNCKMEITPVDEIEVSEVTDNVEESYDGTGKSIIPRPKELSSEEEDILEKNLVWVVGTARSGTTWFGTQLLSHGTYTIDESQIGRHLGSIWQVHDKKYYRDFDNFKTSHDYFFSLTFQDTWKYYLKKLILNRIYAQFQDLNKIIVIKEPSSSIVSDLISECLPNSKIIIILRDGRDVVDSAVDAFKKGSWMTKAGFAAKSTIERENVIERQSIQWKMRTEIMLHAFEKHNKNLRYSIKYEDLRKNTFDELKRIYEFLGTKIDDSELEKIIEKYSFEKIPKDQKGDGKFYRSAQPGKWRENFTDDEITIIEEIMGPMLKKLKYL